jgi:hypothetical protein
MPNQPVRLTAGTLINQANLSEVTRAILSGATFVVANASPTGYTRQFQHQDWIDFVDPVQAGGNNGFNERFHALESEFDLIAAAIGSVDNAVTNLQSAPPAVGLTIALSISNGAKIPVPSGFQQSETKFFAFVKFYQVVPQQAGSNVQGFNVYAKDDGTVVATTGGVFSTTGPGQTVVATGMAIAKKGGW